ncbi:glycosyltransferase family 2 protein [Winogradskyella helgolandensis]|uniref:glycosyltransferase family 2 protein n=1 Tax=Winogradskyella helgolandensis TaxID=2697010 RepID=UPI0015CCB08A|nr:glycosyltransferase family 2 protein [Winogradskyella helgolandensis]
MTKAPLVSIIIPTFNRAHLIGETLDSVMAQTYQNWECIVVDDGSSDGTDQLMVTYCAKDSRFQYHHRPADRLPGGNAARNYGFEVSKGDYVQWFDSDDLMMSEKLELCVLEIRDEKKDLVICNFNTLGKKPKTPELAINDLLKYHIAYGTINTQICFLKKKILNDIIFDESLVRGQEFEFFVRLFSEKKIKFSIIQQSLSEIREHNDSITGKYLNGNKEYINSLLYSKLTAYKSSSIFDDKTQNIVSKKFEIILWRALVFRHQKLYWHYLNKYFKVNKEMGFCKKLKFVFLAKCFFTFKRGSLIIKKYYFK